MGLKRTSARQVWAWWPLYRLLRRERIDVLHAHKFGSNLWGTAIGRMARVPVIVAHEHTWSFEGQPLRRFGDREVIARGSSAFIAVSQEDRRRMIEIEGIDPEDVMFLPNGIPAPPPPTGADVRAELGHRPGRAGDRHGQRDAPAEGARRAAARRVACSRTSFPACAC